MKQFKNLVRPYLIWSFILIVVPLFLIVLYSVTTGGNSLVNIQFTGENFKKIFEPVYMNVFIRSLSNGRFRRFDHWALMWMDRRYDHPKSYGKKIKEK